MAEQKTSISQLTAATIVTSSDLLLVSQGSGASWSSKKAAVGQLPFTTSADLANGAYSNIVANDVIGVRTNNFGPYMGINPTFVEQGLSIGSFVSLTHPVNTSNETWIFDQGVWTYEHPESADPGNEVIARWPSKSGRIAVDADLTGFLTAHQPVSASYVNQHIKLSANNTLVGDIDCSNFIKDGMLSGVDLCSNQLIFKFNTDSGKTAVSVQLSNFIDKNNYYTKSELTSSTGVLTSYSLTSHTHSNYLTAVPNTYKTYANTKTALSGDGYVTGVKVNGTTKSPSSGVVDIGTVLTAHQSLSDYYTKPDVDSVFDYLGIKCCSPETVAIANDGAVYRANIVGEINQQTINFYPMLTSVKTIVFGTNVTSIAAEIFKNNSNIREIIVPTSVSSVGENTFKDSTLSSVIAVGWDYSSAIQTFKRNVTIPSTCTVSVQNIAFKEWVDQNYSLTSHTHSQYVPTSRTVAGQALTANVTAATISSAISLSSYSRTSHNHDDRYMKITNTDRSYVRIFTSLSSTDVTPATTQQVQYAAVTNDNTWLAGMYLQSLSSGSTRNWLFARKKVDGSNIDAGINLCANADKTKSAMLTWDPNPIGDNSRQIATTKMVRSIVTDLSTNINIKSNVDFSTNSALQTNALAFYDNNNKLLGTVYCNRTTTSSNECCLRATNANSGTNVHASIVVSVNDDSSKYAGLSFDPAISSNGNQLATTKWTRNTINSGMTYKTAAADSQLANWTVSRTTVSTASGNKVRFYVPTYISGSARHFYLSLHNNTGSTLSVYFQNKSGETADSFWPSQSLLELIGSGAIAVPAAANRVFEFTEFAARALLVDYFVPTNRTSQLTAY